MIWRLLREGLPTTMNLKSRNIELGESERLCSLYLATVLPANPSNHFQQMPISISSKKISDRWKVLWSAVVYNVWMMRNNIRFNGRRLQIQKCIQDIKNDTWRWLSLNKQFTYSYTQWQADPGGCIMDGGSHG
uniref:Uncharacterized protein n=1 Tax=Cajanus cajan TaxID=3821 RepID=A0A151QLA0_CAJCA|nr:hypothetical protein KK1_049126 [Cajanus cajan]